MLIMIILHKIFTRRMHINKSDNSRHAFPVGFRSTYSTSSGSHTEECSIYSQLLMLWLKLELASLVSFSLVLLLLSLVPPYVELMKNIWHCPFDHFVWLSI